MPGLKHVAPPFPRDVTGSNLTSGRLCTSLTSPVTSCFLNPPASGFYQQNYCPTGNFGTRYWGLGYAFLPHICELPIVCVFLMTLIATLSLETSCVLLALKLYPADSHEHFITLKIHITFPPLSQPGTVVMGVWEHGLICILKPP